MESRNFINDIWYFNVLTTSIMKLTDIKDSTKFTIYKNRRKFFTSDQLKNQLRNFTV